jgi:hypothetical protein
MTEQKLSVDERLEGSDASAEPATGELAFVTLLGDDGAKMTSWIDRLRDQGYDVHVLGVKAPAVAANHTLDLSPDGLVVHVGRSTGRRGVQTLVAHLQHRRSQIPVLLLGPGVDDDFAQWVAVPQGGTPYWGGVYYCEDEAEAEQVLKQIVLFTPPAPAHSHDHAASSDACGLPEESSDGGCCGCPMSNACDLE